MFQKFLRLMINSIFFVLFEMENRINNVLLCSHRTSKVKTKMSKYDTNNKIEKKYIARTYTHTFISPLSEITSETLKMNSKVIL